MEKRHIGLVGLGLVGWIAVAALIGGFLLIVGT